MKYIYVLCIRDPYFVQIPLVVFSNMDLDGMYCQIIDDTDRKYTCIISNSVNSANREDLITNGRIKHIECRRSEDPAYNRKYHPECFKALKEYEIDFSSWVVRRNCFIRYNRPGISYKLFMSTSGVVYKG